MNFKYFLFIALILCMCASVSAWEINSGKYDGTKVTFYSDNTGTVIYNDSTINFVWYQKDNETITANYYIFSIDLKYNQTDNTLYSPIYPEYKLVAGGK